MTNTQGHGLILEQELSPKDWRFGGVSGMTREVLRLDGQYIDFLPVDEPQSKWFETMGCVSFSANNCIEILKKVKGYTEPNYSDRFLAKESGTTRNGNSMAKVAETLRIKGAVPEEMWAWTDDLRMWDAYYSPVPQHVIDQAKGWLTNWDIKWEWVNTVPSLLMQALPYGPLQVTVEAGNYTSTPKKYNHAVTLVGYEEGKHWIILDHYGRNGEFVYKVPWSYRFGHAILFSVNPKKINPMTLPNDILVMETEKSGTFGLHLNGKIIVDDMALVTPSWLLRNNGDVKGKTRTLTKAEWDSFPKRDLKGNDL